MSQLNTFLPHLPLHTILQAIDKEHVARHAQVRGEAAKQGKLTSGSNLLLLLYTNSYPAVVVKVQSFRWTTLSLGWYQSMLWGWIYAADAARVWVGTSVRLFNVLSQRNEISLRSPRGAVDAVGDTIARRIGSLSFNSSPTMREV